jgi:small conductance mechanosensitive channel
MQPGLTSQVDSLVRLYLIPMGWRIAGALAIWLIGSWAIRLLRAGFKQSMRVRRVDLTLATYLDTGAAVAMQLLVLIAVLGVLGVETTSFAALLAAAGIAIGAAWSGLLSNFAAGLFLLTFRPFKVGDRSRSSPSIRPARCWRSGRSATTTITGRSTSIPTTRSAAC